MLHIRERFPGRPAPAGQSAAPGAAGDAFGLPHARFAAQMRDDVEVLEVALAGPGPVDVEDETRRVNNHPGC